MLNILAQFPAAKVGYETPGGLHLRAEALRYAFLDRLRHLADPLAVRVPWRGLASREYAAEVAAGLRVAGPRSEAKLPDAWAHDVAVGGLGRGQDAAPRGRRRVPTEGADCTTHICAVDRQRNMVSLTNTAVSLYGSRMVVPGTGILLQNGMLWFDPGAGPRQLGGSGQAAGGQHGARARLPAGRALPHGRRAGRPQDRVRDPAGDRQRGRRGRHAPGRRSRPRACTPRAASCGWTTGWASESLAALRRMGHDVVPKHQSYGTLYFSRPVAIRIGKRGLEAGLDPLCAAAAAGV